MHDENIGSAHTDPAARVQALIDSGLTSVEAGDLAAAVTDMEEAERVAAEAGIAELATAARINRGYAYYFAGDLETAARLYAEGADLARESSDTGRLAIALANLGTALGDAGKFVEAIATYDEYLKLEDVDASARARVHIGRGIAYVERADLNASIADFEEAERIAAEAGDTVLAAFARNNLGYAYDRSEDIISAAMVYTEALAMARATDSQDLLTLVILNLANAHRQQGSYAQAEPLFEEVEPLYRESGDAGGLASALYWHGMSLSSAGWPDWALEKFREAEQIYRELGQDGELADCLIGQAEVMRNRREYAPADPLYAEAEGICRREGFTDVLTEVLYLHCLALRGAKKGADGFARIEESVRLAKEKGSLETECSAQSLYALMLADRGDTAEANEALDTAEVLAKQLQSNALLVAAMFNRAYVIVCEGKPADDVNAQMRAGYYYAQEHDLSGGARQAAFEVLTEAKPKVDAVYFTVLEAFNKEMHAEQDFYMGG